jgi:hypothetical protein
VQHLVCIAQNSLTLTKSGEKFTEQSQKDLMRQSAVSPLSSLPSLMMPCPVCAGRMVYHGPQSGGGEVEDTVYACRRCGAELIRSSVRAATKAAAA